MASLTIYSVYARYKKCVFKPVQIARVMSQPSFKPDYLYQQVITVIREMVEQGLLSPGDKLPSLRAMAGRLRVSIPTVQQAYQQLEMSGQVVAREKSGYFLQSGHPTATPKRSKLPAKPVIVNKQQLIEQVYEGIHLPDVAPLGLANPVAAASPQQALARSMRQAMRQAQERMLDYGAIDGLMMLKTQIVQQYLALGLTVNSDDLIITNGAQEAIAIALQCVTQPGDIVAIESPCYFGIVELVENLGLKAIEIPVCPDDGLWLDDLSAALARHSIKACVFSTSINNPLGSQMPESRMQQLLQLLRAHDVTLIEDDVYGDLYFGEQRIRPAQCFAQPGEVLTCSSFSKTVAPGYRVGWMLAGPYSARAKRFKRALSCSAPMMNQWALADFMASGEFQRHLRQLRKRLYDNKQKMRLAVQKYFPDHVRVSDPKGGCVLWLDLGEGYDGGLFFQLALQAGISVAPGAIFSAYERYRSCVRISYGLPWCEHMEGYVRTLGTLVAQAKKQPHMR